MGSFDSLGNDRESRHIAQLRERFDGESCTVQSFAQTGGITHLTIADAVDADVVDCEDEGFVAGVFHAPEFGGEAGVVCPDVFLVEEDLGGGRGGVGGVVVAGKSSIANLFNRQR